MAIDRGNRDSQFCHFQSEPSLYPKMLQHSESLKIEPIGFWAREVCSTRQTVSKMRQKRSKIGATRSKIDGIR
jgi:hypothetical protein